MHIAVTDAASSEILASDMLRGRRSGLLHPFFPHIVLVGRDASHACMRLLKRPWQVIEPIRETVQSSITASDSVAQRLFHSPNYSFWLQDAIQRNNQGPEVSSLSAAKHRFASFAKPLGRFILHVRPVFETLHKILSLKSDEDCAWLHKWMDAITGQKLLLLAAASDAADTLLEFTRVMDAESQDPAVLNSEVGAFLRAVDVQFGAQGQVYQMPGYSKHCLDILQAEPPLYVMHRGQQRKLRVSPGDQAAVLQAFKPWLHLCHEAVQAEFPDFHLFSSMGVLDLKSGSRSTNDRTLSLRRLAAALHVDEQALVVEFDCLRPIALAFQERQDCTSREAWKQAYERSQASTALREKYPVTNLVHLLYAHACWTTSTSGVEQAFSKAQRSQGVKHFGPKASESERRAMVVLTYEPSSAVPLDKVVDKARKLYSTRVSRHLGRHTKTRLDKGVKKIAPRAMLGGKVTERSWIAKRRASVRAAAAGSSAQKPGDHDTTIAQLPAKAKKDGWGGWFLRRFQFL